MGDGGDGTGWSEGGEACKMLMRTRGVDDKQI